MDATGERAQAGALAVRNGVAAFALDHLTTLRIRGGDHLDFLQRVLSADLKPWKTGEGGPSTFLTPKARVVSSLVILIESDSVLALVPREAVSHLRAELERLVVIDEVELAVETCALVGVYGPFVGSIAGLENLATSAPYRHARIRLGGITAHAVADDHLASPGVLLLTDDAQKEPLLAWLAQQGALVADLGGYEIARVEAGTPRMGCELSQEILVLEAGQLGAVSVNKGCYIGQEPVCRIHFRGKVNHMLVGLSVAERRIPNEGEKLTAEQRKEAGRVTSAVYSPNLEKVIALGYLHRTCAAAGTKVYLAGGGEAKVVSLPHVNTDVVPLTVPRYK